MNLNIEFKPGYYEWLLYINDELCYVDNDGLTDYMFDCEESCKRDNAEYNEKDTIECYCDMIVEDIKNHIKEDFEEIDFEITNEAKDILKELKEEHFKLIKDTIFRIYYNYYGKNN